MFNNHLKSIVVIGFILFFRMLCMIIYVLAILDSKYMFTGLNNRHYFFDKLSKLVKNNGKENIKSCLLYIDLDNLKYCNDTFGHSIGDYILICFIN